MIDDDAWLAVADAFHAAAVEGDGWYEALSAFAHATGSRHGQLVCMAEDGRNVLNLITDVDPQLPHAFLEAGGADPRINPRRRAGLARPPMTVLAESDFITADACKRDAHYQEFAVPWDVPYICLTTLAHREDLRVGLAVIRSARQGHIDAAGRRAFASLAPHVRSAVRVSLTLGDQVDALLADTFEKLDIPAFVCNRAGVVRRLSAAAEAILQRDRGLQMKLGRLTARHPPEAEALAAAIRSATAERRAGAPPADFVIVHGPNTAAPLVLDVVPLPAQRQPFAFDGRALVLVRSAATDERRRAALLQSMYQMTAAETGIALLLIEGKSAEAIARARNVSVGTVRVQIKSLLAKAGVRRQIELVARFGKL